MNHNSIYAVALLCTAALTANARQRTQIEMLDAARAAFKQTPREFTVLAQDSATAIVGTKGGEWALVCQDDLMPAVLGYSHTPFDAEHLNPNVAWFLKAAEQSCRNRIRQGLPRTSVAPDPSLYEPEMDALVTARWGQEAPYWNMCPFGTTGSNGWGYDYDTPGRCVTGCVATAMAQVLYYHKAPAQGTGGTHSVRVKQPDGSYETYTVNYDEAIYDWDHMRDYYTAANTPEEEEAVAQLVYHCGVAADMEYATDGSGTYMLNCTDGLIRNFGMENATYLQRHNYSEDQWMELVYTELNQGRPIIYAGDDMRYWAGHCFVLDGYDARGFVHINWGWDGSDDGFFDIALLNAAGYEFSSGQEMVIGVEGNASNRKKHRSDTLVVENAGNLDELITPEMLAEAYRIVVEGNINAKDIASLRHLIRTSEARALDLRKANIAEGELADSALALCSTLSKVVLPSELTKLGKNALKGCTSLYELRLYSREVPKLGTGALSDIRPQYCHLYVPAATKEQYKRKAYWKDFYGDRDNIHEFGTAFTVRNCSREQYQENPELKYVLVGEAVEGEPELYCEATPESEPGRYPIYISRGTVLNQDVDFIDGYMIVTESTMGIEHIEADNTRALKHYDLQGRLVSQPQPGVLYITK